MKRPNLREALMFDEQGNCIGFKKDIPAEVRAAWDKILGENHARAWADYLARLSALPDGQLLVLRIQDEELAKLVKDGLATVEEFNAWRRATSSGIAPMLPASVADALYDRVEARMRKGVDRTVCPEGMTDLEHALLVAANFGASGRPVRDANAKRKKMACEAVQAKRNAPRMAALESFRKRHPDCTLPEAAEAMFQARTVPTVDAGKKWLQRMVGAGALLLFKPGLDGRPQMSRGVGARKA